MSYNILSPEDKLAILERRINDMQLVIQNHEEQNKKTKPKNNYEVVFYKFPLIPRKIIKVTADNFSLENGYWKFFEEIPWFDSRGSYFRHILVAQFNFDNVKYINKI